MPVLSELATMTEVAQGTSLARFGHGELAIMMKEDAEHQKYSRRLELELRDILEVSPCLLAAPPFDPPGWDGFLKNHGNRINDGRWYGSSFVSRGDWVPWTRAYRKLVRGLWRGRKIVLVAPEPIRLIKAYSVNHQWVPKENSFECIDRTERIVVDFATHSDVGLVLLSCGPTATILADRLARKGIWAVDLGNFGKFL